MEDFERRMDALRMRFAQRAMAEMQNLQDAWTLRNYEAIRQVAHSLAGNAGLFGYPELGEAARELEQALDISVSDKHLVTKVEAVLSKMPNRSDPVP